MLGKRKYAVSGKDANGDYVEIEVWASSSRIALETAQSFNDGNTYNVAQKKGCGCGGGK